MKPFSVFVASLAVASCFNINSVYANDVVDSVEVEIPVKALLTPTNGFEEKNTIQAVVYGALPNSCYTLGHYQTEQNDLNHTIRVRQFAIKQISGICADDGQLAEHLQMLVPFTNEIHVGNLPAGDYKFIFNQTGGKQGIRAMSVSHNKTPTIDTLPYAIVSAVSVPDVVNGKDDVQVTISGVLNSSCTHLNNKVQVLKEDDVSVLLPTVSVEPGVVCAQSLIPFEKKVNLGQTLPGIHLIHSRSMNGKAINKVIQVSR